MKFHILVVCLLLYLSCSANADVIGRVITYISENEKISVTEYLSNGTVETTNTDIARSYHSKKDQTEFSIRAEMGMRFHLNTSERLYPGLRWSKDEREYTVINCKQNICLIESHGVKSGCIGAIKVLPETYVYSQSQGLISSVYRYKDCENGNVYASFSHYSGDLFKAPQKIKENSKKK